MLVPRARLAEAEQIAAAAAAKHSTGDPFDAANRLGPLVSAVQRDRVRGFIQTGIVVSDVEKSLAFYRDLLGFEFKGEMQMPGGGTMNRLLCGTTLIKLVSAPATAVTAAGGGITGACGYRYFTITVSNLVEITEAVAAAGYKVTVSPRELRPGISISIVEDPDANLVEFLQLG